MTTLRCTALAVVWLALVLYDSSPAQEPVVAVENVPPPGVGGINVGPRDWPQWGGTSLRNNVSPGRNIPINWSLPIDRDPPKNIKWVARLGSVTHSSPIVADGKVFIGTNNGAGYSPRYLARHDLGCLLCFDEATGAFLWQHSNEKLKSGRVHDYPMTGVVGVPLVEGNRLWYVSNRGEVVCLDTAGFDDRENDGPFQDEEVTGWGAADVVWKFDMMATLGTRQHNMCTCSVTCAGNVLFVETGNGVDQSHRHIPAPDAPSFLALDRDTAEVLWTDNSPGPNVLHGQWSSPAYAVLGGRPQVLFPGGDGWLYSFDPMGDGAGRSKLLWKFDCNPKPSKFILGGRGERCEYITLPVIYDNKVYVAVGSDPEHGDGQGHLWCIDPTKKTDGSDVSPTLAYDHQGNRLPPKRLQAVDPEAGETERPNPDSALVWHYDRFDLDGNGQIEQIETMHRSCGSCSIADDLLYIADFSGIMHCVNAATGKPHWTHDLHGSVWAASPLVVDGKVYIGTEEALVTVFEHSREKRVLSEVELNNTVYGTPIVANDVLYIATRTHLYAIAQEDETAACAP